MGAADVHAGFASETDSLKTLGEQNSMELQNFIKHSAPQVAVALARVGSFTSSVNDVIARFMLDANLPVFAWWKFDRGNAQRMVFTILKKDAQSAPAIVTVDFSRPEIKVSGDSEWAMDIVQDVLSRDVMTPRLKAGACPCTKLQFLATVPKL